jgi:hypothetical protein
MVQILKKMAQRKFKVDRSVKKMTEILSRSVKKSKSEVIFKLQKYVIG